jgi:transcriptional regulator with XRE-family HTH domain
LSGNRDNRMMDVMRFDQKLIKLCEMKSWKQADLARAVDTVSRNTVSRWWNGEIKPFDDEALKLARIFGVTLDYLADDTLDEVPALPPDEEFVLRVYRNLKADPAQGLDEAEAQRRLSRPSQAQIQAQAKPAPSSTLRDGSQGQESPDPKRPPGRKGRAV